MLLSNAAIYVLRVMKEAPRSAGGVGRNFPNRPDLSSTQVERLHKGGGERAEIQVQVRVCRWGRAGKTHYQP